MSILSCLLPSGPLCDQSTVCFSGLLLMDTWAIPSLEYYEEYSVNIVILEISFFYWMYVFISLSKYLGEELLGYKVGVCLVL